MTLLLAKPHHQQHAAEKQQVLQGHRPPVEADGQQIGRIRGEQSASNNCRAFSGDAAQKQEKQPQTGHSRQQHRYPQRQHPRSKQSQNRTVKPRFQSADVTHDHERDMGMADADGVSSSGGFEERHAEDGFVVFDADVGQERQAGEQKIQASQQRREGTGQSIPVRFWRCWRTVQLEIVASYPISEFE